MYIYVVFKSDNDLYLAFLYVTLSLTRLLTQSLALPWRCHVIGTLEYAAHLSNLGALFVSRSQIKNRAMYQHYQVSHLFWRVRS